MKVQKRCRFRYRKQYNPKTGRLHLYLEHLQCMFEEIPDKANQWIPIGDTVSLPSSALVRCTDSQSDVTDEVDGDMVASTSEPVANQSFEKFRSLDFQLRFQNVFATPHTAIQSPLPAFNWANSGDVWKNMLLKEEKFRRDAGMFRNHPELQPRMRSILLDWLSEVCEVYRLHKETFTLAVDYLDRYLSVVDNVPKTQLQLLGISSLFIAAKLEEIYPPKLSEFAYVTDSACTEADIVRQEMIILKALKWDLSPMTTNAWLGVYLQVANMDHITDPELGFVFPQFSTHAFVQISRLCDLALMDVGSFKFYRNVIAASALYHHTNEKLVMEVSGLNWADLYPCVKWMNPFAKAILEVGQSPIKYFPHINAEDCHNIQTHNVDMVLLDRALAHQVTMEEREKLYPSSLDLSAQLVGLLTPPSNKKTQPRTQTSSGCGPSS
ncbi:G1/S-specific cyclin-E1 isoform X2 [Aplysia californica]|uniref:G1/S-specific cyclin-E1 isoform X2 n=1 Tax=Aplysia californica TaxID=6500 RepID=A0ABM1A034_APLCA|nr:G1/S-specific cyclin-E1 isoform X2 [Aplysia californica]